MKSVSLPTIWKILSKEERRTARLLCLILIFGVTLEVVSFGALLPAISILTEGLSGGRVPILSSFLGEKDEAFLVSFVVLTLILVFAIKSLYVVWSIWFQREFCRRIEHRLAGMALRHYLYKPYVFHTDHNSADLVRNVGTASQFVSLSVDSLLVLGTDGAVLLALLGLLMVIEPTATAVVVAVLGLLALAFHFVTRKRITAWGLTRTNLEGKKLQALQEGFTAIKEIKAMECENEFASRFDRHLSQATKISRNYSVLTVLPRVWLEFLAFAGLGVLLIALTASGRTIAQSLPELTLFAASAFRLLPTVNRLIFAVQNLRFGQAATEILTEISSTRTQVPSDGKGPPIHGPIEFKDVTFQYPRATIPTLTGVSFQVSLGDMVGVSGESGSGKSTIACLLLGLLKPVNGHVTVGEVNIQTPVGKAIGYVPQSVYLIDDTIRKNVAFGVSDNLIDDYQVLRALSQAHLISLLEEKPGGLDFNVGENGARLSGGQRQRIGIARALYADPKILVLDEATSALDSVTAEQILQEVRSMRRLKTLFIISHDISVLSKCDYVLRLANGGIVSASDRSPSSP